MMGEDELKYYVAGKEISFFCAFTAHFTPSDDVGRSTFQQGCKQSIGHEVEVLQSEFSIPLPERNLLRLCDIISKTRESHKSIGQDSYFTRRKHWKYIIFYPSNSGNFLIFNFMRESFIIK